MASVPARPVGVSLGVTVPPKVMVVALAVTVRALVATVTFWVTWVAAEWLASPESLALMVQVPWAMMVS